MIHQRKSLICMGIALTLAVLCINHNNIHQIGADKPVQQSDSVFEVPRLVETGPSKRFEGGTRVKVWIPIYYSLDLDTRPNNTGVRIDQTVMQGLVHVFIDREKTSDGKTRGPIQVKMSGFTIYKNNE